MQTTALLLGLLAIAIPASASADEGESSLSLTTAYAGFSVPDHSPIGGTLGLDYERGLTDVLWLRGSGGGGAFYDSGRAAYAAHAHLGLSYLIDVLKYVPRVDLGIGGIYMIGDDFEDPLQPLVELGIGLDVLVSRRRSYGVFARFESFLGETAFYSIGARMSWRWGFF